MQRFDLAKFGVLLLLGAAAIVVMTTYSIQERFAKLPPVVEASPVPTFTAVARVAAPVLVSPLTGSLVTAGVVDLHGTAQPGYAVQALIDGVEIGRATAGADGSWVLRTELAPAGERTIRLRLLDAAGVMVSETEPLSLAVTLPAVNIQAPVLDTQVLAAELAPGLLELGGTGEPGTSVQVMVEDQAIGVATVGDDGRWSFAADVRLPGVYALQLNTVDGAGQVVATATPVLLAVAPPAAAVAAVPPTATESPAPTATTAPSATATPSATPIPTATQLPSATATEPSTPTPSATATPRPTPTATIVPPAIGALNLAPVANGAILRMSGTGPAQAELVLRIDASPMVTTLTGADGGWAMTATLPAAGEYALEVVVLAADGAAAAVTAPLRLQVAPTATPAPTATDTSTATPPPTPSATASPSATSTPVPTATATDTPLPTPSTTSTPAPTATLVPTALPTGTATPVPTATVPATTTATDTPAPSPTPTVAPPVLAGLTVGSVDAANAVIVEGTGQPGAVVRLQLAGEVVASTTVGVDGRWIVTQPLTLTGDLALTLGTVGATGEVKAVSAPVRLQIMATATPVPTATDTPVPTATDTATSAPTKTATPIPTATPVPTVPTATDTATSAPTKTATPVPTATDTATSAPTKTATPVPTVTDTATSAPTKTATPVPTATDTATSAPTKTATPIPTATDTATSAPTKTATPVPTVTDTATSAPTKTHTPVPTVTDTATSLPTKTHTPVPTVTDTATSLPTKTHTPVPTVTDTATSVEVDSAAQTVSVAGVGAPNSTVTLRLGGQVVVTTTVDATGTWRIVAPLLDPASETLEIGQVEVNGQVSSLPLPPLRLPTPTIAATTASPAVVPAGGDKADAVNAAPAARGAPTPAIAPVAPSTSAAYAVHLDPANSTVSITGTGTPGASVALQLGVTVLATTTVEPGGQWQLATRVVAQNGLAFHVGTLLIGDRVSLVLLPHLAPTKPPTATLAPTATSSSVPPTLAPTATNTAVPASATPAPTEPPTPVPPTATHTSAPPATTSPTQTQTPTTVLAILPVTVAVTAPTATLAVPVSLTETVAVTVTQVLTQSTPAASLPAAGTDVVKNVPAATLPPTGGALHEGASLWIVLLAVLGLLLGGTVGERQVRKKR